MTSLVKALERFNRKERNLLFRAATKIDESSLQLSDAFRKSIATALKIEGGVPHDAWWATDYHISWLAGALSVFVLGDAALDRTFPNPKVDESHLVEPNQEDFDLVVSWENKIVFMEAKAYGYFSNSQLESKLSRLELVYRYYQNLAHGATANVDFRLLLISPREPEKINIKIPLWLYIDNIPWIELDLGKADDRLLVSRCNAQGDVTKTGDCWRPIRLKAKQ